VIILALPQFWFCLDFGEIYSSSILTGLDWIKNILKGKGFV